MKHKTLLCILLTVGLSSCGLKVTNSISVPLVPVPQGLTDVGKGAMVFVEEVKDMRPSQDIGSTPSGPIRAEGSASTTVREAVEELLRKSGFNVTDSAPIVLQVQLLKWSADVRGSMSATVDCSADLTIEVFDPGNKLAYTGTYKGSSQIEQTGMDDHVVKDALATAMSQALTQFSRDIQIQKLIASF